ncbi:MAG TPA: dihydrolipoamide acetyltransferase family protein [Flavobacteriaceae bacterium]|jgi:2-oxoglutarate dehydrogenase E2 component (dihydrolipoamide succinyltransferase)|nr:dihydrolipoamide acetyltransferase family protein [Flavobacteriaceae bacterium]|tara:strand:+ start:75710 stop:77029 length:1320 start_codon:yes stop_codon:yes gene_type:complete
MGKYYLKLPKMGESIAEATLTNWLKNVGDKVDIDEPVVEIATDKVDSDIPSEYKGVLVKRNFQVDQIIKVGEVIAEIETNDINDGEIEEKKPEAIKDKDDIVDDAKKERIEVKEIEETIDKTIKSLDIPKKDQKTNTKKKRFYSPLVKSIAKKENISSEQLDSIKGLGKEGRVTKADILNYLKGSDNTSIDFKSNVKGSVTNDLGDQIIEMDRMSKIIFDHMSESKKISAHVQSFVEADVTSLWDWREKNKSNFLKNENEKLTFTPLFIFSVIKALRDFPILNSSVENEKIVVKKSINIGMATSLDNGNLIVPVIKNADHLNLKGLAIAVNDLSNRARNNSLKPDDISDGTYTVTNVGNFGSIMGTPIINQPQVGILAIGVIRKLPSVIETANGDFVGIRKKLILSHSYDHRIINGSVGSSFVKRVAEYLEKWDISQTI